MPTQRHVDRSGPPEDRDIRLWHLGIGLLVVGGALGAAIGLPPLPRVFQVRLGGLVPTGSPAPSDLGRAVEQVSSASAPFTRAFPAMPTMIDVELFFRSPSTAQLDAVGIALSWVAWLLWLWLLGTTVLRIGVVLGERAGVGASWLGGLRVLSDRITLALVRQAVDATLAGGMFLRAVVPMPAPVAPPRIDYAQVQWDPVADTLESPVVAAAQRGAMVPDLQPRDVLYTVQPGDNLSAIAERYYGDPAAFNRIVEANLGRAQPSGQTLRDARFIYPGWQLVVPEPTQTVFTDPGGERWYTVRAGDTLSGISARLLGDAQRYSELFADNQGVELGDGHVLTNPNLIWPGLHLRLPLEAPHEEAVEPPHAAEPAPPSPTSGPATSTTPTPIAPESIGQATSTGAGGGNTVDTTFDGHVEPTPAVLPPPVELPVRAAPGEEAPAQWPALWLPGNATADLGVAAGLAAAALLAVHARRRRRTLPEPESDTRVDVHAFTLAEPAAVMAGRATGSGDDPHGVVLGELLAGELLRHARVAELADVNVISVMAGRSGSAVTLSTSLRDRPLLEATLRTQTQLARRIDVSRSSEQDIVVRLQGVRHEALARVTLRDCPVLLCLGMLPDSRSYLVGWEALGHVLAAAQPGTTDAEEHVAALVATLAGQFPPSDLHLYTVTGDNAWLGQLAPLPHQRAVIVPTDAEAVAKMLATLRTEVERRQLAGAVANEPQLVLVASELADICTYEDLTYLLSHGLQFGVRVVGATADSAVERGPLIDLFDSHLVFGLEDEEASTRMLGTPWALTLAEPGRLLVRLGQRKEVEVLGLHLTEGGRRDLLATMGVSDAAATEGLRGDAAVHEREGRPPQEVLAGAAENSEPAPPNAPANDAPGAISDVVTGGEAPSDSGPSAAVITIERADSGEQPGRPFEEAARNEIVIVSDETARLSSAAVVAGRPGRVGQLLARAPLVVDCEEASIWSTEGRLGIGQSSPVEVLVYLAAAPLLHQGRLADWPGVKPETLLAEVWAPRARDPDNRDSGQTWLGKNLGRLQDELERATGGLDAQIIVKRQGGLHLNDAVVVSDVEAFMAALERARAAHGVEQVRLAEEAFGTRVTGLLSRVVRKPRTAGPRVEFYRWLGEPHWERAARRLEALGRDAGMLLARAYRDAGRHEDALASYDELLSEDPLDLRAREGLLMAAAGTREIVRLEQAWQQVCACLGGEDDTDARILYDKLRREVKGAGPLDGKGVGLVAVAGGGDGGGAGR